MKIKCTYTVCQNHVDHLNYDLPSRGPYCTLNRCEATIAQLTQWEQDKEEMDKQCHLILGEPKFEEFFPHDEKNTLNMQTELERRIKIMYEFMQHFKGSELWASEKVWENFLHYAPEASTWFEDT